MDISIDLLKKEDICKLLSISPRGLEGMVKKSEFPPPVRVGKFNYWSTKSIDLWRRRR